jgi:thiamine transport system ATP-binding protein
VLQIEQLLVRYGHRAVIDRVDLTLEAAETIAVLGPSGSGKTTLLRAVAGLQPLDGGRIGWDGDDLATVAAHERRFGLMFQEYALFPHRDVAGNVEFGLRMTAAPRKTSARRVEEVLELVGLAGFGARRVASLSGGEQQRVALARALAVSPRLLMLDEPLGALDRVWRRRLLGEIRTILDRSSLAALYVTHDHEEAFSIASRVAIMRDGRIVQVGAPADVWRAPADVWTATFLGFGPVVEGEVRDGLVHTPWGLLVAPAREPAGLVEVVVRPEGARLDPDGPVDATVVQSTFAGTHVELAVTSGSGASRSGAGGSGPGLTIVVPPSSAPVVGDRVRVAIDPDALLVYRRRAD